MVEKAQKKLDFVELSNLLKDPIIMRIVIVLYVTHLSVLELLEYALTRQDVSRALSVGVIEIERIPSEAEVILAESVLLAGDTYFQQFLSSKVKLTTLGLHLLDCVKGCQTEQEIIENARQRFESGIFFPPEHPSRPE